MKIVLAQNMFYLPSHGGANRSNRMMLEQLAARGHECHAVVPLSGRLPHPPRGTLEALVAQGGGVILHQSDDELVYRIGGVTVHGTQRPQDLFRSVTAKLSQLQPDWCLVPSDDPASMVLSAAFKATERVIYLVHTIQQLPFGPRSFYPSTAAATKVARSAGRLSVSRAAQHYLLRWGGLASELYYPDVYSARPGHVSPFGQRKYITMVNASAYKGISIFLAMADSLTDMAFLAIASWGTTPEDLEALAERPNVTVAESCDDIDLFFDKTWLLVMPSLWDETFGYTCVEALLRGIPVLSSGIGGLAEAGLGAAQTLPVSPIEDYRREAGAPMPVPVVPRQDSGPWVGAVRELASDPASYRELARRSHEAARRFVAGTGPDTLEKYLLSL